MPLNLVDQRYGMLTVIEKVNSVLSGNKYRTRWLCLCDCGEYHIVLTENLRAGYTNSCGCKNRTTPKEYTGLRFGRLTVLGRTNSITSDKNSSWICICDCGNTIVVSRPNLREGYVKSCGCLVYTRTGDPRAGNINKVLKNYTVNAARRNLAWVLTREQAINLFESPCVYDGRQPNNISVDSNKLHPFYYNGLDRLDNTKGYTVENTVPACWMCNRAKGKTSHKEFIEWLINAGKYQLVHCS